MRLARIDPPGAERPTVSEGDGPWLDLAQVRSDITADWLCGGLAQMRLTLRERRLPEVAGIDRFGPPLARPGKIVCIGLNYRDHAAETHAQIPAEPIVFLKRAATMTGPDDDVLVPRGSTKTDWEVEVAVVMGGHAPRYLDSPDTAAELIAGYAISNDVSEREFQLERGGQWDKGKNCETLNPFGPWLLTTDELPDPQQLGLRLRVNGVQRQDGCTKDMIFGVHYLVWYLS